MPVHAVLPGSSMAAAGLRAAVACPPGSRLRPIALRGCGGRSSGVRPADGLLMIVDDEPINVKVLQKHLKIAGYSRFITTSDAMSVLDCIRSEPARRSAVGRDDAGHQRARSPASRFAATRAWATFRSSF